VLEETGAAVGIDVKGLLAPPDATPRTERGVR